MNAVLEVLYLRRPRLNYVSPPVCEAIFSSSASPVIILEPLDKLLSPTGIRVGGIGHSFFSWRASHGQVCYSIYVAVDPLNPDSPYNLFQECVPPNVVAICSPGYYKISTVDTHGVESALSSPVLITGSGYTFLPLPVGSNIESYNLYKNPDQGDINAVYDLDINFLPGNNTFEVCTAGCYRVAAITTDGETPLSDPVCTELDGCPVRTCSSGYHWDASLCSCLTGGGGPPVGDSYAICDWTNIRTEIAAGATFAADSANCDASVLPAWDGVFDHLDTSGDPFWYFLNQSLYSKKVTPTESPDYPSGPWQVNDNFTEIYWSAGVWHLWIGCTTGQNLWHGVLTGPNTNPAGTYQASGAAVGSPSNITVVKVGNPCPDCPNWSNLVWSSTPNASAGGTATFSGAGPDFSAAVAAPNDFDYEFGILSATGTMTHTGAAGCECKLHINLTLGSVTASTGTIAVKNLTSGLFLLDPQPLQFLTSGSYDFFFASPLGTITPQNIQVQINLDAENFFGSEPDQSISFTGYVTNL
jgi:hypothetical protein